MKREKLLLTPKEGENAVEEWVAKNHGYWDDVVPVLAKAALKKFIRLGGVIRLHSESIEEIEP